MKCERVCKTPILPPLLSVNRQVRADTLPIFYGGNCFKILGTHRVGDEAPQWIRRMGETSRGLLKRVRLATFSVESAVNVMEMYGLEQERSEYPARLLRKLQLMEGFGSGLRWVTFTAL